VQQLGCSARQGKLPEAQLRKRNGLVKFCGGKTGTKEASELKQIFALAVSSQPERGEGLSEVAVLPQQVFKKLLARVQRTLKRVKRNRKECWFPGKFCMLNPKLGDYPCRFPGKFCMLNPKLGDYLCRFWSSFALSTACLTRNTGTMRIYICEI
jgi:hypothetical protein